MGVGHLWVCEFAKNLGGWVPQITPAPCAPWLRIAAPWFGKILGRSIQLCGMHR